jgi:hypothetical protein
VKECHLYALLRVWEHEHPSDVGESIAWLEAHHLVTVKKPQLVLEITPKGLCVISEALAAARGYA